MIRVIRGRRKQLNYYFSDYLDKPYSLWLTKPNHISSSWEPLLDLLDQVSKRTGPEPVENILSNDLAAASFADEGRIAKLSEEQLARRHYYSSRYSSHLSHNWYLHRPLFEAWAKIIYGVLTLPEVADCQLIVPSSQDMIGPINSILKTISRLYPEAKTKFTIVIGFERDMELPTHDSNGINWNLTSANPRFSGGFLQVADLVESLPEDAEEEQKLDYTLLSKSESLPLFAERIAFQTLASSQQLNDLQIAQLIEAMALAYQGLGFHNTVKLGLGLFALKPVLSQAQKAKAHGLLALAAHNRQFSAADKRLHDFLLQHFLAAYDAELESGMRSALCYRIAVTYGRRMKQPKVGLEWADKALIEASSGELTTTEQAYYHNWGINIKAYLFMITRQLDVAYETGESVFNTVHQHFQELRESSVTDPSSDNKLWQREMFATVQVLRRNMFALCYHTSQLEQFRYWLDKMEETTPAGPELRRATYVEWAEYYSALLQPGKVLEAVSTGTGFLRKEPETELFLDYSKHAILANYQVGELSRSHNYLEKYRSALDDLAMPWYFEFDLVKYAPIYLRDKQQTSLDIVLKLASEGVKGSKDHSAKCIDFLLLRGQVFAREQDRKAAEEMVNAAIDLAVADGERNLMMRVARIAGWCNDTMGAPDEALQAYGQALELSSHAGDVPPWPEELFLTLINFQRIQGPNTENMELALKNLPAALEQMEAWWELCPTLEMLVTLAQKNETEYREMISRESLWQLIEAAGERADCKEALKQLTSHGYHSNSLSVVA